MFDAVVLYQQVPDRLYIASSDYLTWYAVYEREMCILTNASGCLEAYCYPNKTEFRDVRRFIVQEYDLFMEDIIQED